MKIVVVDGQMLNPGDLSWAQIEKLAETKVYQQTKPEETIARCADADIVVTNKVMFDEEVIAQLPKLKFISVTATGYNVIDLDAARRANIIVSNVPAYSTKSVAQLVFAHLLELTHHIGYHNETVKNGKWAEHKNFCYWDTPQIELDSLTMGIVGLGKIGSAVAALAQAFGMRVLAFSRSADRSKFPEIEFVAIEELFSRSDVVSLNCALTSDNEKMVNSSLLKLMKPSSFLINTSRGPLIDEADLAEALNSGKIAGAGVDVLSTEPPKKDNPLLNANNCIITPHIAWATDAARGRLISITAENIKAFINSSPINVVS